MSPSHEEDFNTTFNLANHDADDASRYLVTLNENDEIAFLRTRQLSTA